MLGQIRKMKSPSVSAVVMLERANKHIDVVDAVLLAVRGVAFTCMRRSRGPVTHARSTTPDRK